MAALPPFRPLSLFFPSLILRSACSTPSTRTYMVGQEGRRRPGKYGEALHLQIFEGKCGLVRMRLHSYNQIALCLQNGAT